MKLNREMLKQYAMLGDAELWREICAMGSKYGYKLPPNVPSHAEMEKIRTLMRGDEKIGLSEAMKLLNEYKSKK